MRERVKLGISSCLLGEKVRYDGGDKLDLFLRDTVGKYVEWTPVCPEAEYGLSVPREAMRLEGDPGSPRLLTIERRMDHTAGMLKWAEKKVEELERLDLSGFVFKSRSPSCGIRGVEICDSFGRPLGEGAGIFAGLFLKHFPFLPLVDEEGMHDPSIRENFFGRVISLEKRSPLRRRKT